MFRLLIRKVRQCLCPHDCVVPSRTAGMERCVDCGKRRPLQDF